MSSPLVFRISESESTFLDPRKDFQPTTARFQVRFDPLTGRSGHFSHFGAIKPQALPLAQYATPEIKGFCPFCPENREKVTPKFPAGIIPEGRLKRNQALLTPNLFPYDIYSSVTIVSEEHVVPLEGFTPEMLKDAFSLGLQFLKRVRVMNPSLPFHIITWNYMPPSGGGLVHPHQQAFATGHPGNLLAAELAGSEKFNLEHGVSYWSQLIKEEEQQAQRFIGSVGRSAWLSSFVSHGIFGEVTSIFPEVFSIEDFSDEDAEELVSGLLKVFHYYRASGVYSFNASLVFGPGNQKYFPCRFRIIARTFLNMRNYAGDLAFFQALLAEPVSLVLPEALCQDLKGYF
jgi:UDPglucose--hexose-1-phosphate uridylyltransferase